MGGIRLQKILARAGVSSRRAAEELIREGRVRVNGAIARELGTKADPEVDRIQVDGRRLAREPLARVLALHKPRGVVTTLSDPQGRPSISDLVPQRGGRLFPVGRLDFHSEGLLLLTNDGDLAQSILRPSSHVPKTYHVKVRGTPPPAVLGRFARGLPLDGRRTQPARVETLRTTRDGNAWLEIVLHEGRRNQIRRLLQMLGHPVQRLRRVAVGPVELGSLRPGESRVLDAKEVEQLRTAARAR